ncbi:MAG TPA: hypothetical protein HA264_01785 [Methanolinea sp.]|nr:hypothetical protein [Methanolinea sp.]
MRMVAVLSGLVILLLICALALLAFQSPAPTLHPGSLDCTFNSPQGYVMSTHAENEKDRGVEVAIQDDGHIVALGYCNNTRNEDLMIARYTSYGALDSQFGSGGFAYYDGGGNDRGLGLVLQGDGKMVATGFTQNGSHRDLLLLRYDLNGTLDPTFGNEGVVMFSAPGSSTDIGFGVVWESDGGIFVAGETANATHQDALVIHYTPEGVYDTRFAGTGLFTYGGTNMDRLFACALQPDGKILVTGSSAANEKEDLLLLRMNHDGTLDGTFGVGGVVLYSGEGDNFDYGNWVLVQPDGKILVSGATSVDNAFDLLLMRYNPDGTPDPAFGIGGVVHHGDAGGRDEYGYAHAVQQDGKIIVAGYAENATYDDVFVVRFYPDGTLDTTFGDGGQVLWNGPGDHKDYGQGIALQRDGKIVVTGFTHHDASEDLLVMRLWP